MAKNVISKAAPKSSATMQRKAGTKSAPASKSTYKDEDIDGDDDEDIEGDDSDDEDNDDGDDIDVADGDEDANDDDDEDEDEDEDEVEDAEKDEDESAGDDDENSDDNDDDGEEEEEEEVDDDHDAGLKTVSGRRSHAADYFDSDFDGENDDESIHSKESIRGRSVGHTMRDSDEQSFATTHKQVEKVANNVFKLIGNQQLVSLQERSPEVVEVLVELKERVSELREKVTPLRALVGKMMGTSEGVDDDIVDYLKVKQQMLLSYCIHVTFYLYMKVQGQSVRIHPVMRQLLELRYVMEKMRSLDGKMKHQIDRLMKQNADMPSSSLRPNPDALVPRDDDDDDDENDADSDEDDDDADEGRRKGKTAVYKAPKMAAMPYRDSEADADRREERMRRQRKKLSNSEIMETLREEFGTAPEAASSSGLTKVSAEQRRLQEEAHERKGFEEDRFVRLTMSRKEKQSIKKRSAEASRLDNFNDFGDIADFEEFMEMSRGLKGSSGAASAGSGRSSGVVGYDLEGISEGGRKWSKGTGAEDAARALQRAVSAFAKPASLSNQKPRKIRDVGGSDAATSTAGGAGTGQNIKSRPSLSAMMDDDDDFHQSKAISTTQSTKARKGNSGVDLDRDGGSKKRQQSDHDGDEDHGKSTSLAKFARNKKALRR